MEKAEDVRLEKQKIRFNADAKEKETEIKRQRRDKQGASSRSGIKRDADGRDVQHEEDTRRKQAARDWRGEHVPEAGVKRIRSSTEMASAGGEARDDMSDSSSSSSSSSSNSSSSSSSSEDMDMKDKVEETKPAQDMVQAPSSALNTDDWGGLAARIRQKTAEKKHMNENKGMDVDMIAGEQFWDDMSGEPLVPLLVEKARMEEMDKYRKHGARVKVPEQECYEATGRAPIGTRWVDKKQGG